MPIAVQELLAAQRWRYATKSFDPARSIPAQQWQALEDCLVLSPSSYGLQPWKFLVIDDPALRQELRPHSWNQSQITDCSHLVVLLAKRTISAADADRFVAATAAARTRPRLARRLRQGLVARLCARSGAGRFRHLSAGARTGAARFGC